MRKLLELFDSIDFLSISILQYYPDILAALTRVHHIPVVRDKTLLV